MTDITGATIPVLRKESFDYSEAGNDYPSYSSEVKILKGAKQKVEVRHKLTGGSLVHDLVRNGKAKFGCELILKGAFWRETHIEDTAPVEDTRDGQLECLQTFGWNPDNTSQSILFRPVVVASSEIETITLQKKHNVTELWIGQDISIPKFALLADHGIRGADVQAKSLLRFKFKKEFAPFEMDVVRMDSEGRTHFTVYVGRSLLELVRSHDPDNSDLRRAIMIGALASAFGILQRDYINDPENESAEISRCDILSTLSSKLRALKLVSWDDDPEDFSPINAATRFEKFTWSNASTTEGH